MVFFEDKKISEPQRGSLIHITNTPKYNCGVQRFSSHHNLFYIFKYDKRTCIASFIALRYKIFLFNALPNNK